MRHTCLRMIFFTANTVIYVSVECELINSAEYFCMSVHTAPGSDSKTHADQLWEMQKRSIGWHWTKAKKMGAGHPGGYLTSGCEKGDSQFRESESNLSKINFLWARSSAGNRLVCLWATYQSSVPPSWSSHLFPRFSLPTPAFSTPFQALLVKVFREVSPQPPLRRWEKRRCHLGSWLAPKWESLNYIYS